jgi:hypothetical protein
MGKMKPEEQGKKTRFQTKWPILCPFLQTTLVGSIELKECGKARFFADPAFLDLVNSRKRNR